MAFEKFINEKILTLMFIGIPLMASTNIDCGGKSFHCLNSTHFMICVDLGNGVSTTVDDYVIPCPPPTMCQRTNHFECQFPVSSTQAPTVKSILTESEIELTTLAWEPIVNVTTTSPIIGADQNLELTIADAADFVTDPVVIPEISVGNETSVVVKDTIINEPVIISTTNIPSTQNVTEQLIMTKSKNETIIVSTTDKSISNDTTKTKNIIKNETQMNTNEQVIIANESEISSLTEPVNILEIVQNVSAVNGPQTETVTEPFPNVLNETKHKVINANESELITDRNFIELPTTSESEILNTTESAVLNEPDLLNIATDSPTVSTVTEVVGIVARISAKIVPTNVTDNSNEHNASKPFIATESVVISNVTTTINISEILSENTPEPTVISDLIRNINVTEAMIGNTTVPTVINEPVTVYIIDQAIENATEFQVTEVSTKVYEGNVNKTSPNTNKTELPITENVTESIFAIERGNELTESAKVTNTTEVTNIKETLINMVPNNVTEPNAKELINNETRAEPTDSLVNTGATVFNKTITLGSASEITTHNVSEAVSSVLESATITESLSMANVSATSTDNIPEIDFSVSVFQITTETAVIENASEITINQVPEVSITLEPVTITESVFVANAPETTTEFVIIANASEVIKDDVPVILTAVPESDVIMKSVTTANIPETTTENASQIPSAVPASDNVPEITTDKISGIVSNVPETVVTTEAVYIVKPLESTKDNVSEIVSSIHEAATVESAPTANASELITGNVTKIALDVLGPDFITESVSTANTLEQITDNPSGTVSRVIERDVITEAAPKVSAIEPTIASVPGMEFTVIESIVVTESAITVNVSESTTDTVLGINPSVITESTKMRNISESTTDNVIDLIMTEPIALRTTLSATHNHVEVSIKSTKDTEKLMNNIHTTNDLGLATSDPSITIVTDSALNVQTEVVITNYAEIENVNPITPMSINRPVTINSTQISTSINESQDITPSVPVATSENVINVIDSTNNTNTSFMARIDSIPKNDIEIKSTNDQSFVQESGPSTLTTINSIVTPLSSDLVNEAQFGNNYMSTLVSAVARERGIGKYFPNEQISVDTTSEVNLIPIVVEGNEVFANKTYTIYANVRNESSASSATSRESANQNVTNIHTDNPGPKVRILTVAEFLQPENNLFEITTESELTRSTIDTNDKQQFTVVPDSWLKVTNRPLPNPIYQTILSENTTTLVANQMSNPSEDIQKIITVQNINSSRAPINGLGPLENKIIYSVQEVKSDTTLTPVGNGTDVGVEAPLFIVHNITSGLDSNNNASRFDKTKGFVPTSIPDGSFQNSPKLPLENRTDLEELGISTSNSSVSINLDKTSLGSKIDQSVLRRPLQDISSSTVTKVSDAKFSNNFNQNIQQTISPQIGVINVGKTGIIPTVTNLDLNGDNPTNFGQVTENEHSAISSSPNKMTISESSVDLLGTEPRSFTAYDRSTTLPDPTRSTNETNPLEKLFLNGSLLSGINQHRLSTQEENILTENRFNGSIIPDRAQEGVIAGNYFTTKITNITGSSVSLEYRTTPVNIQIQTITATSPTLLPANIMMNDNISPDSVLPSHLEPSLSEDQTSIPSEYVHNAQQGIIINSQITSDFVNTRTGPTVQQDIAETSAVIGDSTIINLEQADSIISTFNVDTSTSVKPSITGEVSIDKNHENNLSKNTEIKFVNNKSRTPNVNDHKILNVDVKSGVHQKLPESNDPLKGTENISTMPPSNVEVKVPNVPTQTILNGISTQTFNNGKVTQADVTTTETTPTLQNGDQVIAALNTKTTVLLETLVSFDSNKQVDHAQQPVTSSTVNILVTEPVDIISQSTRPTFESAATVKESVNTPTEPSGGSIKLNIATPTSILTKLSDSGLKGHVDVKMESNKNDDVGAKNINPKVYVTQSGVVKDFVTTLSPEKAMITSSGNTVITEITTQSTTTLTTVANTVNTNPKEKIGTMTSTKTNESSVKSKLKPEFKCQGRATGRYADNDDCRKFYICSGIPQPIVGLCPFNTVFSNIRKLCTKNLSHCIRQNEFHCISDGRFADFAKPNVYYICVRKEHSFLRFKLQCQNGYYLNKSTVRCYKEPESSSISVSVSTDNSQRTTTKKDDKTQQKKDKKKRKSKEEDFTCKKEGRFAVSDDCRKFYICWKIDKDEYKLKVKKCDSDEIFHRKKKRCVDASSYECK